MSSSSGNDSGDNLAGLDIKIVDQSHLEREVAIDADKTILSKELQIEEKRLAKANEKYTKYSNALAQLKRKLDSGNLKISEKTRLSVQIEELEENELISSLNDLHEIKARIKDIKLKMESNIEKDGSNFDTSTNDNGPVQLPDETRDEYLIRTGKITAFGTANSFITENDINNNNNEDVVEIPSHKNLRMPGINTDNNELNNDEDSDIEITHSKTLTNDTNSDDFKIDYDEINSDYEDDEDDYIYDDIDNAIGTKSKKKTSKKITSKTSSSQIDDGNERYYQQRLSKWVNERSSLRKKHNPEYIDNPLVDEWYKPHPTVKDAVLHKKFKLPGDIFPSLFDYQKTCVQWLSELHSQSTGGIIGDEMGLGKTVQMISFLAGLHYSKELSGPILIVCPATVLKQWCDEFHRWWPPFRAVILHSIGEGMNDKKKTKGKSKKRGIDDDDDFSDFDDLSDFEEEYNEKSNNNVKTLTKTKDNKKVRDLVNNIVKNGHVIITTYAGVRIYAQYLLPINWGYVVLDEGHKIRNPDSFITITCKQLKTPNRIILSGTPIQNNLIELWSLFDFIYPGRLGTLPIFQRQFCIPINLGGYANATNVQVQAGYKCAVILKDLVTPYLLRRLKSDVARDLPKKTEMVLFCKLTTEQRTLYQKFIDSNDLKKILSGKRNALFGIDILRKICNHPNLVDLSVKGKKITTLPKLEELTSKSGKLQVVIALLELWTNEKRKILIFTQTKQMLNILEQMLQIINQDSIKYNYMRMDGSTPIIRRQELVDEFNNDPKFNVFLLTTKVGGLGVNLTGASRVIIFDPDWNPSTDMQARERAWRLGQKQDVSIYRLIMAGSIEEKIYHRQIFKQFLTNKILKDPKQKRFFKMTDINDLFTLGDDDVEGTETADLFNTEESKFNGIKKRKTKFKSRFDNNINTINQSGKLEESDKDFINATKKAGVARLEKFDDANVKEKSMFDDDDSRVKNNENNNENNSNLMFDILKKSGIHSAVQHDDIINKTNIHDPKKNQSQIEIENEATKIANEAILALRKSRELTSKSKVYVPTWTGKHGSAGKLIVQQNKLNNITRNKNTSISRSASPIVSSSNSILNSIKKRKTDALRKPVTNSESLVTQLSNYMAGVEGNFSKSADVLENLDIDFSDTKTVDVVRNMLKGICTWDKERKGWVLKPEFR
ncbi:DNA-dependent ATPase [Pichia kluyveri]|uniref:DNA-dependent ATPase n=1 Tax=Pichia kluyveri TaxID=36015 RepID=A0AAV5R376_PICKL|nr:DNA-dependent ATPase [Pichia kluyveri]